MRKIKMKETKMKEPREYLLALSIDKGLITLIKPNGEIGVYRQRGIPVRNSIQTLYLIEGGHLSPDWSNHKELPKNWSISFENEEIMGKARATFPKFFK